MRKLIFLRGLPGSGKSTFLQQQNLEQFSLSKDSLRLTLGAPILEASGVISISQEQNLRVFDLFRRIASERMDRGEFLILESMFLLKEDIQMILELAKKYRYQVGCVDFTSLPLVEVLNRNALRQDYKRVSSGMIEKLYKSMPRLKLDQSLDFFIDWTSDQTLEFKTVQLQQWLSVPVINLSQYEAIVHIGDVQGCLTPLIMKSGPFHHGFRDDTFYIFVGDLVDRGLENGLLLKWFLKEAQPRNNVALLWGNHELHLQRWSQGLPPLSDEFKNFTLPQLIREGVTPEDAGRIIEKTHDVFPYVYHGRSVLVTHAGLSTVPAKLHEISTYQYSHGTGHYEDPVGAQFHRNAPDGWEQVHGHRNHGFQPVQSSPRSFCLEGGVENGGQLRIAKLTKDGWTTETVINPIFKPYRDRQSKFNRNEAHWMKTPTITTMDEKTWQEMITHEGVRATTSNSAPHITALNFERDVFFNKTWDDIVVKARGLFVNTSTKEIVARGYDKFFNVGERPETQIEELVTNTLTFPIDLYVKENGFLGNLGYDSETDQLFIASKSTPDSDFANFFKEIFQQTCSPEIQEGLRRYLRDQEASMVFEVIDPVRDPHMIEYAEPHLVLLDVFRRSSSMEKLSYTDLESVGRQFNLKVKQKGLHFKDGDSFKGWMNKATQDLSYKFRGHDIEGFVIEDQEGFQTKVKLPFYAFWKKMRSAKDRIAKLQNKIQQIQQKNQEKHEKINEIRVQRGLPSLESSVVAQQEQEQLHRLVTSDHHPLAQAFIQWCIKQPVLKLNHDIIELRSQFQSEVLVPQEWLQEPWVNFSLNDEPAQPMAKKTKPI